MDTAEPFPLLKELQYYAGIGSRQTPPDVLEKMAHIAKKLEPDYILRSGGAAGADQAFANVVKTDRKQIFRPLQTTPKAVEFASHFHPAWHLCSDYVRLLMGRNVQIVLGKDLNQPVRFVVCWTPDETRGGTSLGIKIARRVQIPVINLFYTEFNLF